MVGWRVHCHLQKVSSVSSPCVLVIVCMLVHVHTGDSYQFGCMLWLKATGVKTWHDPTCDTVCVMCPLCCCCSASNYLLGLTPVQLGPLVVGTVAGMSVWSILYASLGGASKVLLESGESLDVLLAGEQLPILPSR